MHKYLLLLILLGVGKNFGYAQQFSSFIDPRDGIEYKTVKIGDLEWMAENLNTERFRNGKSIPQAKSIEELQIYSKAKEAAWCYYSFKIKNEEKYGKMYNGYAVINSNNIAPQGWHVPSLEEYKKLASFLGGDKIAVLKLKSNTGWAKNKNGTNSTGFNALPGGETLFETKNNVDLPIKFEDIGRIARYWSTTTWQYDEKDASEILNVLSFGLDENSILSIPLGMGVHKSNYLYIRCVKD